MQREEIGPSGFSVVSRRAAARQNAVQKSYSLSHFNNGLDQEGPLQAPLKSFRTETSSAHRRRPLNEDYAKPPPLPTTANRPWRTKYGLLLPEIDDEIQKPRSRRSSITDLNTVESFTHRI